MTPKGDGVSLETENTRKKGKPATRGGGDGGVRVCVWGGNLQREKHVSGKKENTLKLLMTAVAQVADVARIRSLAGELLCSVSSAIKGKKKVANDLREENKVSSYVFVMITFAIKRYT